MAFRRAPISGASMSLRWGKGTFLSLLRPEDLFELLKLGRQLTYWAGQRCEALPEAGAPVVLLQAWAKAVGRAGSILRIAGAGDLLGLNQLELLDDPWDEDTIAMSVARVLVIQPAVLTRFVRGRPSVSTAMLRALLHRQRQADLRTARSALPGSKRLAGVLYALALQYGIRDEDDPTGQHVGIPFPLMQTELASLAGVSLPSATRALNELRNQDLVDTGYRAITILDPDGLRRFAGEECPNEGTTFTFHAPARNNDMAWAIGGNVVYGSATRRKSLRP